MPALQKPENALKKADDYVAANQHGLALNLLLEIVSSKRARVTPIVVLEPIMMKFIQLCVHLGKGQAAKEALYQYRNISQTTNVSSIETVIKSYINLSTIKFEASQNRAQLQNVSHCEDLDVIVSPESLMASVFARAEKKEVNDGSSMTVCLRFLWESYRTALDTLKNNTRLEAMYHIVAQKAMHFCLKYERKSEFRRLCETLRQHLNSASKYASQANQIDLNDSTSLQRNVETKFEQLKIANEMNLLQEGFRTIEDIHSMTESSDKAIQPRMLSIYYKQLAKILTIGNDNYLFHSAAYLKYLSILRDNSKETDEMASTFMISALSIPLYTMNSSEDNPRSIRLTELLIASKTPTRALLLKKALGSITLVRPEIQELYKLLEVEFDPLTLCTRLTPIMNNLKNDVSLEVYFEPLCNIILTRLLQQVKCFNQLSQVYSNIKIESVVQLVSSSNFFEHSAESIQKFVASGCQIGDLNIRIDQENQLLLFKTISGNQGFSVDTAQTKVDSFLRQMKKTFGILNPRLIESRQSLGVDSCLFDAANVLVDREENLRLAQLTIAKTQYRKERAAQLEKLRQHRVVELQLNEEARLAEQEKIKASGLLIKQRREIELSEARKVAQKIANQLREKNIKVTSEEMLDTNKLISIQNEQTEREKRDLAQKSRAISKRIDHTERAFRQAELPLLKEDYEKQKVYDEAAHNIKKDAILFASREKHQYNLVMKNRLTKIKADYNIFREQLNLKRQADNNILLAEAQEKINIAKEDRRRNLAKTLADKLREEEAKREILNDIKKAKELEIEKARKQSDMEAQLAASAEKQREKEAEIEARLSIQKADSGGAPAPAWRTRLATKEMETKTEGSTTQHEPEVAVPAVWTPVNGGWRDKSTAKSKSFVAPLREERSSNSAFSSNNNRTAQAERYSNSAFSSNNTRMGQNFGSGQSNKNEVSPQQKDNPSSKKPVFGSGKWANANQN